MKTLLLFFVLLLSMSGRAQVDTLYANRWQAADTIYGNLSPNFSTGLLMNRTLLDTVASFAWNTDKTSQYTPSADYYYRLLYELKLMAVDSSAVPSDYQQYLSASTYTAGIEFDEGRIVYPMGIIDYNFDWFDEIQAYQNGLISFNGLQMYETPGSSIVYQQKRATLIAPMMDYLYSEQLSIVFRSQDFLSNSRSVGEITSVEVFANNQWNSIGLDQEFDLTLPDDTMHYFQVRIGYQDGTEIMNEIVLHTPLGITNLEKGSGACKRDGKFTVGVNKLEYCLIPSCLNPTLLLEDENVKPYKPYVLLTGYRPPVFGQSFEKTWEIYNTEHAALLEQLLDQGYDIVMVRFNIHATPQGHGLMESAQLLRKFIEFLNDEKLDKSIENILAPSSMSCDIVDLALLQMESEHFNNSSYDYHHCRLVINYDGNFLGANLPLAYQYQIYSGFFQKELPIGFFDTVFDFFRLYLFATMQQKTVQQLLMYHAVAGGINVTTFEQASFDKSIEPSHNQLRQEYYDALYALYNGNKAYPMPNGTRNVAISLGKISETNDLNPTNDLFNSAGENWRNDGFGKVRLRTAIYSSDHTQLFHREKLTYNNSLFFPQALFIKHNVNVKHMQEIDNASGSFLNGVGNLMHIANQVYFGPTSEYLFSHKSVFTGFAIHPNYWPVDGSFTLNMQDLGLMYPSVQNYIDLEPSPHYGYPNLGRPNDHFSVTPFEAIYVDEQLDPHIRLLDSDHKDNLNSFILNEVEPDYLGLQNEEVGTQVRANYLLQRMLQARHGIYIGHTVTPRTDPGNYTVHPNVDIEIRAGQCIDVLSGTTFLPGCKAELYIDFEECNGPGKHFEGDTAGTSRAQRVNPNAREEPIETRIRLFPNPSDGSSTLLSMDDYPIESLEIYNFSGNLIYSNKNVNCARYEIPMRPARGTYIVLVRSHGILERLKWIVL